MRVLACLCELARPRAILIYARASIQRRTHVANATTSGDANLLVDSVSRSSRIKIPIVGALAEVVNEQFLTGN